MSKIAALTEGDIFSPEVEPCEAEYSTTSEPEGQLSEGEEIGESAPEYQDNSSTSESECASGDVSEAGHSEEEAVGRADALELKRVRQYFRSSCGCKLGPKGNACSTQFTPEAVKEQRENCATLEKEALDMFILGQFQAHSSGAESNKTNRQYYIAFHYRGKRICRNFFLFIHSISLKRYRNLLEHHHKHGAAQRVHGNKHKAPHSVASRCSSRCCSVHSEICGNSCYATPWPTSQPQRRQGSSAAF